MDGWIKLYRQLVNWRWYLEPNTFRVFIHLLLKANHQPKDFLKMTIETGQLVTSYTHLAMELKLSVQNIRTAISNLITTKEITKISTNRLTIITINNYSKFQEILTSSLTNEQQPTNKRLTTNKKDKNERIKEKEIYKEICKFFLENDFQEVWNKWLNYRIEIKHPLKDSTIEAQLKLLGAYPKEKAILTIEKSIQNGWQGLFPDKVNGVSNRTTPIKPEDLEDTKAEFIKMGFQHL